MKKTIIDTNAILRFLLKDVPSQHEKVENLIGKAKNKRILIIIPEIVVFEVFFTLKSYYKYGKDTLLDVIESLVSAIYFKTESKPIFMEAIRMYRVTNLGFVDCFLVVKGKIENVEIYTFDKNLNKYAKIG